MVCGRSHVLHIRGSAKLSEEHGLQPRMINRTSGYDLYKAETWEELRRLRRRKWPRRLWFSLPYTKWDHWSSVNYNTEDKKERLDTARRKERRLLWYANQFIKEATHERTRKWTCTSNGLIQGLAGDNNLWWISRSFYMNMELHGCRVEWMAVSTT